MHGKQSHSINFMNLLECLHAQTHVSSPHRLPHTCLSQYASKNIQFSQQKFFVLENLLPSFGKIIWTTLRGELLDNSPKQSWSSSEVICWTSLPGNSSENLPSKLLSQTFSFCFISCLALTPNILGCPSAYGMHYANSKSFILIQFTCIS